MQEHKRLNITIISARGSGRIVACFQCRVALNSAALHSNPRCLIPIVTVRAGTCALCEMSWPIWKREKCITMASQATRSTTHRVIAIMARAEGTFLAPIAENLRVINDVVTHNESANPVCPKLIMLRIVWMHVRSYVRCHAVREGRSGNVLFENTYEHFCACLIDNYLYNKCKVSILEKNFLNGIFLFMHTLCNINM